MLQPRIQSADTHSETMEGRTTAIGLQQLDSLASPFHQQLMTSLDQLTEELREVMRESEGGEVEVGRQIRGSIKVSMYRVESFIIHIFYLSGPFRYFVQCLFFFSDIMLMFDLTFWIYDIPFVFIFDFLCQVIEKHNEVMTGLQTFLDCVEGESASLDSELSALEVRKGELLEERGEWIFLVL